MAYKLWIILLTFALFHVSRQDDKPHEDLKSDIDTYAEMASSFLKDQNAETIGGMISSFVQSEGGKQLGDVLMGMGGNNNANQVLQSLGSLISSQGGGGDAGAGFDPTVLASVLGALNTLDAGGKGGGQKEQDQDPFSLLSMVGGMLGQEGGMEGLMGYLPMLLSTVNSFTGAEAQKRVENHAGHAWFLPPILERAHLLFDHFMSSDMGKTMMRSIGTEKFIKVFADSEGRFSFAKFAELLENHSFRKHWIELVTRRIATFVSYFADPKVQKKFMTTAQYFINSLLKAQGFPKAAMFDPTRPTETLSAFINYAAKKYLSYKVSSKQYVKPAVEYVQDLLKLAQKRGFFTGRGIDSSELSHKLADTINLEIIEPVARVYRAYRFAKRHPKCDRYVMCLVNQQQPDEVLSLPGLKSGLSKFTSLFASWFLGSYTGTSFWSLYNIITDENNCQARFHDACNDFHIEEIRVTTEYVHNEL